MSVRRLSKAPRGFLVCPLPDVFEMDAAACLPCNTPAIFLSPATFQSTECLIGLPFYLLRAVAIQVAGTRGEPICEFLTNSVQVLAG
jgi:hypothetical protein